MNPRELSDIGDTYEENESSIDPLEIAVAAEMARQHGADARDFLHSLADLLERALPGEAEIVRSGFFGGDKRPIKSVVVSFAEGAKATRFRIEAPASGPLVAEKTQIVRNVALKTEPIEVADWIQAVSVGISRRAAENKSTRDALRGLL